MKTGDIVIVYSNPISCEHPEGRAKLIEFLEDLNELELWKVEFLDHPEHFYSVLIKKYTDNLRVIIQESEEKNSSPKSGS